MKAYYTDSHVTIYHGDCREVLSQFSVRFELLLTDPPYGIGGDVAIHCTKPSRPSTYISGPKYAPAEWDTERPSAGVFAAMLAVSNNQIIWGGNYFADLLPASRGWLFWDKLFENTTNFSHGELAWTSFSLPLQKFAMSSKAETAGGKHRVHPTQKPVALMRWCLAVAKLSPYSRVLDPFMGSGSSLVAAKQYGHLAVGIELEEKYCEIAAQRLAQGALFGEATA